MDVLRVENVSKQYRLGTVGTGTLSHDLNRWWHKVRGLDDPYAQIGETNDRTLVGESEYVWALKNINFNIERGEALGIIGKNGAGKSTLLKILSQVTSPTTGKIKIKGRVASLLEVGTGFHPDLSGRENVFLNGAVLGMTKAEIKRKFDEIVDFSGCAKYIDTPVKRYSSGMKVRLGFAVAAHLEPEILIVDEVLAVGDAEFQRKCLGKMHDVTGEGRTVIFVSHNMTAIKNLCQRGIVIEKGDMVFDGDADSAVQNYYSKEVQRDSSYFFTKDEALPVEGIQLKSVVVNNNLPIKFNESFDVSIHLNITSNIEDYDFSIHFCTEDQNVAFTVGTSERPSSFFRAEDRGEVEVKLHVPANLLNTIIYSLNLLVVKSRSKVSRKYERIVQFEIQDIVQENKHFFHKKKGAVHPLLQWEKNSK